MTPLGPLVLCWLAAPVFLLLDGRKAAVSLAAVAVLGAVTVADLALLADMAWSGRPPLSTVTGDWPPEVGIRLYVDGVSLFFGAATAAVMTAALLHERAVKVHSSYFPALMLFMAAGLHGAYFTGDLFNFYVFFEVSVVSSFALAAYGYGRQEARGAFIYIAVNLFGSMLFLIGVTVVYHGTGTLDFVALWRLGVEDGRGMPHLGAAMLFAALSLKLGLFPLHYWVPVLYSHTHPAVAAVMSGALINIGAYGLLRIGMMAAETARAEAADLLMLLGALAVVYGAVVAAHRSIPAEIVAYASIAQAGYVVLALGVGGRAGSTAALFAVLAGAVEKSAAFLSLESRGWVRSVAGLVAAMGIAGLPLTMGFVAKVELFRAAWGTFAGPALIAALMLGTMLLFVATARFWEHVRQQPQPQAPSLVAPAALAASTVVLAALAAPLGALLQDLGVILLKEGGR